MSRKKKAVVKTAAWCQEEPQILWPGGFPLASGGVWILLLSQGWGVPVPGRIDGYLPPLPPWNPWMEHPCLGCSHRLCSLGVFTWPLYSRNWNEFRLEIVAQNFGFILAQWGERPLLVLTRLPLLFAQLWKATSLPAPALTPHGDLSLQPSGAFRSFCKYLLMKYQ